MNVQPYGMEWHKPVSRLEEAIRVMKLLWSTDKPVDFDGEFFQLRDAVLGLSPYEGRMPQLWLAAHGPRMLRITGRHADGWLPTNIRPDAYAEKLAAIRESAEKAGRDPDAIVPSMLAYVICAPDEESLERMCNSPMARVLFAAVDLPAETYERHGSTSPFEGGTGFHSFVPTRIAREEVERDRLAHPGRDRARAHAGRHAGDARRADPHLRRGRACATSCCGTSRRSPTRTLSVYSFRALRELRTLLDARRHERARGPRRARHRRQPRHRARDRARAGARAARGSASTTAATPTPPRRWSRSRAAAPSRSRPR